ncbi:MAG: hypothetical protein J5684_06390 [Eubacterium sp.]|nr:hypothetical protein [Eubacterium sp.]
MKKCKILSIVLAMGLFVASLNTGFISEAASKSAEYVYVMTKVQSVGTNYTNTLKYTYNADGLMKKEECIDKSPKTGDTKIVTSFTYSKGYIKSSKQVVHNNQENSPATYNSKYNYDSKKRLKKVVCNGPDNYEITTKIDYDKKNRKTKETMVITNWPPKCVNNYTYNKKGQIVKFSTNNFGEEYGIPVNEEFKYDKKGFINHKVTKSTFNGEVEVETTKRKAGYKNGRIVKATDKVYNKDNVCTDTIKTTYTYKRIKINKKYKKQIENQQAEIIFNVTR